MMKNACVVKQDSVMILTALTLKSESVSATLSFVVSLCVTRQPLEMGCADVSAWKLWFHLC